MNPKYYRNPPIIQKTEEEDSDFWLKKLEEKLETTAVQSKKVDQDLFEQINAIMNGSKSKYTSVGEAVEEMKQRSGLNDYLRKRSEKKNDTEKTASEETASEENVPHLIKQYPLIKQTLENMMEHMAYLPTPAIIDNLKKIYKQDVSDVKYFYDSDFIAYVDSMRANKMQEKLHIIQDYSNIGSADDMNANQNDPSNTDVFHALMPVKD